MEKRNRFWIAVAFIFLLLTTGSCRRDSHFLTDKSYRTLVHNDYLGRTKIAEGRKYALFSGMDSLDLREREAMEFLYAYMPYSDLADYDYAFFLKHVRFAFMAQREMAWGRLVPEDIFRHFVLPYRVNNENLDTARMYMYSTLKERVKDMSMEEAALEVNHWCHEHVAYRGSDSRTSAPLATMRTALGRCGEESTFAVAALRSVGIPARQCYTPRWAHCDDNHAWVEVWVYDTETKMGTWKFLGACEPDPMLNMGWFAEPSSRCMMVHTKAFGRYHGDEEVVKGTSTFAELNLLSHYAPVCHATAKVIDSNGNPVSNADVKFKLYNYAEYYTLATFKTKSDGTASLTTGRGDLLAWATDGTCFGYTKLDTRKDSIAIIRLERREGDEYVENIDIVPPVPNAVLPDVSDAMQAANGRRLALEDSLRNAYVATFCCNRNANTWDVLPNANLTQEQLAEVMRRCEGNYGELTTFLNRHTEKSDFPLYDYLKSFSDKDMRDITAEVLESHVVDVSLWPATDDQRSAVIKGLIPARISNELVRPWRQPLAEKLNKEGVKSLEQLKAWTAQKIAVDDTGNYYNCPISPVGVYELRHSDAHSRDIFFVAACRSLGIPAYIDNATNEVFAFFDSRWTKITLANHNVRTTRHQTKLTVSLSDNHVIEQPKYWSHYTIQRYDKGDFVSLDFEDDERVTSFPFTLYLEPGYYCLSTGNRDGNGTVSSRLLFFTLPESGERVIKLVIRPVVTAENLCNQNFATIDNGFEIIGGMATIADYAGDKGFVFISLGDYREPSKHLVNELIEHRDSFARWGGMIYMLVPEGVAAMTWDLPCADISVWRKPADDPLEKMLVRTLEIKEPIVYPLVAIIRSDGKIPYSATGYKIGAVEQLLHQIL